jgi:hypothetical protein
VNDLIARAGQFFVAPAPPVAFAPPRTRAATVGVLAPEVDLLAAAGAEAAALRRAAGASAALVCVWRRPAVAPAPGLPAAARLAAKLRRREIPARAAGALCVVALPHDAAEAARAATAAMAAADAPAVVATTRRDAAFDGLLATLDALVLAAGPATDPVLAGVATADLAGLGPPVERRSVAGTAVARRFAALGLAAPAAIPPAVPA